MFDERPSATGQRHWDQSRDVPLQRMQEIDIMRLETLQHRENKLLFDMQALIETASAESRGLTDTEKQDYATCEKSLKEVGTQIQKLQSDESFTTAIAEKGLEHALFGAPREGGGAPGSAPRLLVTRYGDRTSLGDEFIASAAGKHLKDTHGKRSGAWRGPDVELKALLLEDNLPPPQVLPGIVPSPQRPIVMSELFAIGPTSSNTILYMEETLYTNSAAPVAEGGLKPESTMTFANKTSRVEKIAHWLPVSDEFLDDEPALRSHIDNGLRKGVLQALDHQLLHGTGVSPQLLGLLVRTDLTPPLAAPADMSGLDAIAAQIAAVEDASQLDVDGIVMNGADWLKFALLKTSDGSYLGGNPFDAPTAPTLWGRRVALTTEMPQGTAIVGSFRSRGGQLYQRGGLVVQSSNSHSDYFIRDITAIRAEVRMALVLLRPVAYGLITGLNPVTP